MPDPMPPASPTPTEPTPATLISEPTIPTTEPAAPASLLSDPAPAPAPAAVEPAPASYVPIPAEELTTLFGDTKLPEETFAKVSTTFADLRLDKAGAEKAVALYSTLQEEAAKATAEAWNTTIKGWQDQAKAHPDFGGAKFDASLAQAKQVVDDYGDQGFKEMLAVTGVGNHPALIGFILKLAKAIPGDAAPAQTTSTAAPRDLASLLFPNHGAN